MVSQYAQLRLFQRLKLDLLELRYVLSLISIRTIKKTTAHLLYIYIYIYIFSCTTLPNS